MATELILTVSQISTYIKNIFESEELLINVKVCGEITNLKPSQRAIYFDIKDENSALPCVCFDSYLMQGYNFGDKVVVTGRPNYYAKTGKLSFIISKIEKFGVGDLHKQYLLLKDKLQAEGLFDEKYKKSLPKFVKKVGVVTSETGAVIRDIIRVKNAKNKTSSIVLYPVKVQGVGSDDEIVKGIKYLDSLSDVEVIIVARGGGSFEDYAPFNTEKVVRAVFNAQTPIVSAIGHENDWSLIDFASDVRASTPSVASEVVFFDEKETKEYITKLLKAPLMIHENKYKAIRLELNNISTKIKHEITNNFKPYIDSFGVYKTRLYDCVDNLITKLNHQLEKLSIKLNNNNPIMLLKRGYTRTLDSNGKSLNKSEPNIGDEITTITECKIYTSIINNIEVK
ncbi:MAG: exodeoxyribonuclease VII large subunit [Christensenellales bacterium]